VFETECFEKGEHPTKKQQIINKIDNKFIRFINKLPHSFLHYKINNQY